MTTDGILTGLVEKMKKIYHESSLKISCDLNKVINCVIFDTVSIKIKIKVFDTRKQYQFNLNTLIYLYIME
jgi:hypothetical protein